MKICYVITKADEIGGAQVHVRDLAKSMVDQGHDVVVITGEKGELVEQLEDLNIKVLVDSNLKRNISLKYDIKAFFSLRRKVAHFEPDLLALHSTKAGIIGRLVGKSLSIPTVFTVHGWAFALGICERKRKAYIIIERIFAKLFTNYIITVSEQDRQLAIRNKVGSENFMKTVHNGISVPLTKVQRSNVSCQVINLVMVARFSEQKDHLTLFNALEGIDKTKWRLKLVGKGALLDSYKKLAKEKCLSDNIEFLGERRDVADILSHSDIFLLISNWEGYPLSTLEAMAIGLPVIATDVGGVSEALVDNENGYLIPRGDHLYLRDRIEFLMKNPHLMDNMSKNNVIKFDNDHTLDKMVSSTVKVYELACGKTFPSKYVTESSI